MKAEMGCGALAEDLSELRRLGPALKRSGHHRCRYHHPKKRRPCKDRRPASEAADFTHVCPSSVVTSVVCPPRVARVAPSTSRIRIPGCRQLADGRTDLCDRRLRLDPRVGTPSDHGTTRGHCADLSKWVFYSTKWLTTGSRYGVLINQSVEQADRCSGREVRQVFDDDGGSTNGPTLAGVRRTGRPDPAGHRKSIGCR